MKRVIQGLTSFSRAYKCSAFSGFDRVYSMTKYPVHSFVIPKNMYVTTTSDDSQNQEDFSHDNNNADFDNARNEDQEEILEEVEEDEEVIREEEEVEGEEDGVVDEMEVLRNENDDLKKTVEDLKQNYARTVADRENTRRIAQEDVKKATNYAISSFAIQICDISDNLTMATNSIENILELVTDMIEDENLLKRVSSTFKGIDMTNQLLKNTLLGRGIVPMDDSVGQVFDPEFQSAVFKRPTEDLEEANTIAEVVKCGYFINERVLRATQVIVFVEEEKPVTEKQESDDGGEEEQIMEEEEEPKMI